MDSRLAFILALVRNWPWLRRKLQAWADFWSRGKGLPTNDQSNEEGVTTQPKR